MIDFNVPLDGANHVSSDLVVEVLGLDPDVATEIKLCNVADNSVITTKISKGSSRFDLSLENILTQIFIFSPLSSGLSIDTTTKRGGRFYVDVDGVKSNWFTVIASRKQLKLHDMVSVRNGITPMTHTQNVEVGIVSEIDDKISAAVTLYSTTDTHMISIATNASAPYILLFGISGWWLSRRLEAVGKNYSDYTSGEIVVMDERNHTEIARKKFQLLSASKRAVRLAWVNRYGGVDFYSFPVIKRKVANVDKERSVRSVSGRFSTVFVENQMVVQSEFLEPEMFEQLSEVVSSHSVWMYNEEGMTPVSVNETAVSQIPDKLQRMEITIVSQTQIEM